MKKEDIEHTPTDISTNGVAESPILGGSRKKETRLQYRKGKKKSWPPNPGKG